MIKANKFPFYRNGQECEKITALSELGLFQNTVLSICRFDNLWPEFFRELWKVCLVILRVHSDLDVDFGLSFVLEPKQLSTPCSLILYFFSCMHIYSFVHKIRFTGLLRYSIPQHEE